MPWCEVGVASTLSFAFKTCWCVSAFVVGVAMASCPLGSEASMLSLEEASLPLSRVGVA